MRFLSLLLLGPWLLVLAWAYWAYPKSLPRTAWRRSFDALALLLAAATTVWLALTAYDGYVAAPADAFGRHSGAIWRHVAPALYAYGGFLAVLAACFAVRAWLWRRRGA
ncbi:MAG TPA: hypothetical protein VFJ04_00955 [Rhodanobacteraceae bacterium]|jgi:hypothetical protein|nr:hypothetical protein [Rhodanobacteraceae bacterium]